MAAVPLKVLIVEDDSDIQDVVAFMIETFLECEIQKVGNGKIALEILEKGTAPDLIISDYNMPQCTGGELFVALRRFSDVPFVLHSSDDIEEHAEFANGKNIYSVRKPATVESFQATLKQVFAYSKGAINVTMNEREYVKVPLSLIEKMRQTSVPVYMKLSDTHYVKVAHAEQSYDAAELQRYRERGKDQLCIRKQDLPAFISAYENQITEMLAGSGAENIKASTSLTSASLQFLREVQDELGFTPEIFELTKKNIKSVLDLVSKHPQLSHVLENWQSSGFAYADRCTLAAMIATGLAKKLNWVSETTGDKLAFAAVLHDIGLKKELLAQQDHLVIRALDHSTWVKPDMVDFIHHPRHGAEILTKWPHCPSDVDNIVLQHHERPDGRGFPSQTHAQRISPLASVFIFSLDLAKFVVEGKGKASLSQWLETKREEYSAGAFRKILAVVDKE